MTTATEKPAWTEQQLADYIEHQYEDPTDQLLVAGRVKLWLDRGDGVAVYENHDFGHPEMGSCRLASYGSPNALLEMSYPPDRLPDIGTSINWRYVLIATCKRKEENDAGHTEGHAEVGESSRQG